MKTVPLSVVMAIMFTLAHADDMPGMISRYRREHGLPAHHAALSQLFYVAGSGQARRRLGEG